jgi:hypothetical protein
MSQIPDNVQTTDAPIQMAVLDIPEGRADEVLAFIEKLRDDEAEVAGYAAGTTTKAGYISGTNCSYTTTGSMQDFGCTDSDQGAR